MGSANEVNDSIVRKCKTLYWSLVVRKNSRNIVRRPSFQGYIHDAARQGLDAPRRAGALAGSAGVLVVVPALREGAAASLDLRPCVDDRRYRADSTRAGDTGGGAR